MQFRNIELERTVSVPEYTDSMFERIVRVEKSQFVYFNLELMFRSLQLVLQTVLLALGLHEIIVSVREIHIAYHRIQLVSCTVQLGF